MFAHSCLLPVDAPARHNAPARHSAHGRVNLQHGKCSQAFSHSNFKLLSSKPVAEACSTASCSPSLDHLIQPAENISAFLLIPPISSIAGPWFCCIDGKPDYSGFYHNTEHPQACFPYLRCFPATKYSAHKTSCIILCVATAFK